ncbi:hypothetical protein ACFRFU_40885 [Streptomyces sp. NPDC056704]|uniref:hypothetical protein n=1 Tax=Streptomyces sp. NPDC056704 TaxID=3345917 RepID=UPI0036B8E7A6
MSAVVARRSGTAAGAARRCTAAAGGVEGSSEVSARAGASGRTGARGDGGEVGATGSAPPFCRGTTGPLPAALFAVPFTALVRS